MGGSNSVDLDKVIEVAKKNPANAIMMLVVYLKLKENKEHERRNK